MKVAIVGLGNRGKDAYAAAIAKYPERAQIVAVADVDAAKVREMAAVFHIPENRCYSSAEALLKEDKLADVLFICTQDRQHVAHAIPALRKGYDLLLEKPISPDLEECREILRVNQETKRKVVVCHVLRYTPFYKKIKELIDSGRLGDVMCVQAMENVGYYHQAHSFVRGNWCNSDETSPMILQKCCHDMDILIWLTGKRCRAVSSFGSLHYFRESHAPEGAALRCLDGCRAKADCPYDAEKIYIQDADMGIAHGHTGWPNNVLALHPTVTSITEALEKGPYGRCVFHCGNNVVDHQVVNLDMEDGSTVSFTMCGFTANCSRYIKVCGTLGELVADTASNLIRFTPFGCETEIIDVNSLAARSSGHGGGDAGLIEELLDWLETGKLGSSITTLERSVESHYMALAAEKSRLGGGKCVALEEMRRD